MGVRPATLKDARLLAELNAPIQQLHAQARPKFFKPPMATPELIASFESLLSEPETFVFIGEASGKPIGYMVAIVIRRPENPFTYAMDFLLVDQISINPQHQGKGFGKQLLEAAYDLARSQKLKRIVLNVWDFNIHAIEFYKSQGFRVFNERMEIELR